MPNQFLKTKNAHCFQQPDPTKAFQNSLLSPLAFYSPLWLIATTIYTVFSSHNHLSYPHLCEIIGHRWIETHFINSIRAKFFYQIFLLVYQVWLFPMWSEKFFFSLLYYDTAVSFCGHINDTLLKSFMIWVWKDDIAVSFSSIFSHSTHCFVHASE